jgi:type I restriction enzyme, S subunit
VDELMRLCDELETRGRLETEQHARLTATLFDALAVSESPHALAENWTRIAARFDLLLDRPEAVEALEQTILQLAVRGLLVPQDANDEQASELLRKIRLEKDRLIAEGKIKRDKPTDPIADDEKPFEVPAGWTWARTPQIAERRLGKMLDKAKNRGASYPYLRNTNVQWNRFELDDIKTIQLEDYELDEYRLRSGIS